VGGWVGVWVGFGWVGGVRYSFTESLAWSVLC
jgi:hypothetical protein